MCDYNLMLIGMFKNTRVKATCLFRQLYHSQNSSVIGMYLIFESSQAWEATKPLKICSITEHWKM